MGKITRKTITDIASNIRQNGASNTKDYLLGLLPILDWLPRYKIKDWLPGDLIAGITVALVVIPQSLVYAKLAGVPVQYGLCKLAPCVFVI